MQKYHIRLTDTERQELKNASIQRNGMEGKTRAKILLSLDENKITKLPAMKKIAARCGASEVTLRKVRKKFVEHGLDAVLNRSFAASPCPPIFNLHWKCCSMLRSSVVFM